MKKFIFNIPEPQTLKDFRDNLASILQGAFQNLQDRISQDLKALGGAISELGSRLTGEVDALWKAIRAIKPPDEEYPRWDDLRVEPVARTTGARAPVFTLGWSTSGSIGIGMYLFDDVAVASEKEVFFNMQTPHGWKGNDIHIHVHWVPLSAGVAQTPRWGLEYAWADVNAVFPGTTTTIYATGNVAGDVDLTANKHHVTTFGALTPTTSQDNISSVLVGRLFRNSSDAADTYTANCGLLYIDAHVQLDSPGSQGRFTKY